MKRRLNIYEKIVMYLNDTDSFKRNNIVLGVSGDTVYLLHNSDTDGGQRQERLCVAAELIKIGLGYKTTLGKTADKQCQLTLFDLNFKGELNTFNKRLTERIRRQNRIKDAK